MNKDQFDAWAANYQSLRDEQDREFKRAQEATRKQAIRDAAMFKMEIYGTLMVNSLLNPDAEVFLRAAENHDRAMYECVITLATGEPCDLSESP